jgi:FG-GAP-like repeat
MRLARRWTTPMAVACMLCLLPSLQMAVGNPGDVRRYGASAKAPRLDNLVRVAGIKTPDYSYSATGLDVDRDGDQDLFIGNHTRPSKLWRNDGRGHFTRIARDAWPKRNSRGFLIDRHFCAWADVDRNGRSDAYCTTGRTEKNFVKHGRANELWLQRRRSGRFVEVARDWGVRDLCGRGRTAAFVRANRDKLPDLFVANAHPRPVEDECNDNPKLPSEKSKLYINIDGRDLRHAPRWLRADPGLGAECVVKLDFNGDGWQDLYFCHERYEPPALFRNQRGLGYVDVTARHSLSQPVADAAVTDLDRDGDPDLVTAARHAFHYQLNTNGVFGGRVLVGSVPADGHGWRLAIVDIDGDGDRDVYGMIGDSSLESNPNDILWLRNGWKFTAKMLRPAGGLADDVVVVKPWRNGQPGVLVLNGYQRAQSRGGGPGPGPIALLRWDTS